MMYGDVDRKIVNPGGIMEHHRTPIWPVDVAV